MQHELNDRDQELDALLDRSLKARAAEPLSGFEERLLARIANEQAAPAPPAGFRWPWFALAAAAMLAVVLGIWLLRPATKSAAPVVRKEAPSPSIAPQKSSSEQSPVVTAKKAAPQSRHIAASRIVTASVRQPRDTAPRLGTFPAPAPLTAEERQLLQLARNAAQRDSDAIAYMRLRTDDEIAADEALNRFEAQGTVPQNQQYAPSGSALKR